MPRFLFLLVFFICFLELIFLFFVSFSFRFCGWLKSCEFFKKRLIFLKLLLQLFTSHIPLPRNTSSHNIHALLHGLLIGHSSILTLFIGVLPSRCAVLYYMLGAQQFLRSQFIPRSKVILSGL